MKPQISILFFGVFICLTISLLLMGSVPPVSRDALTHHLAVPKIYIQGGGIRELPHIIPSYYPQFLDLLYAIPMMFGNDIIPKYIHFSFALLTALLIFFFVKRHLNSLYGGLAALFFLSLPVIIKLSVTVYVDLGLIFFSTAALFSLIRWKETEFTLKWLFISGASCGLAMSCKYNGLITCFILSILIPWVRFKTHKIQSDSPGRHISPASESTGSAKTQAIALCYGVFFLLVSLSIFSPWMIKNYIWTQNPIYPLYENFFNPGNESSVLQASEEPVMSNFLIRKIIYKESFLETMTIPVRIFFQGKDDNPKYFDGRLNPLLFFLPIFAFFFYKKSEAPQQSIILQLLLVFSVLYILIVFFRQDMRIRWVGPSIPPLVILSVFALKNILNKLSPRKGSNEDQLVIIKRIGRMLFLSVITIVAFMNVSYLVRLYKIIDPISYLSGQVSRDSYIEKFRPEYPVLQYANQNLAGHVRILELFLGNRIYYLDHEVRGNQVFFKTIADSVKDPESLARKLKQAKITTLIINVPSFNNWMATTFDTLGKHMVQDFFNSHTRLLFSKNDHGVFSLL